MYCDSARVVSRASAARTADTAARTIADSVSQRHALDTLRNVLEPLNDGLDRALWCRGRIPEVVQVHADPFSPWRRHAGGELELRDDRAFGARAAKRLERRTSRPPP